MRQLQHDTAGRLRRGPATWGSLLLLFAAFSGVISCADRQQLAGEVESGSDRPEIDAIFAYWDESGSPGCALAVAQDGNAVYSRGYGYANLDNDIRVTPETVFDVGSLTKQVVAASLVTLALDGKLSLDDSVRKWLPELPAYTQAITLRQMLLHTSGFRLSLIHI